MVGQTINAARPASLTKAQQYLVRCPEVRRKQVIEAWRQGTKDLTEAKRISIFKRGWVASTALAAGETFTENRPSFKDDLVRDTLSAIADSNVKAFTALLLESHKNIVKGQMQEHAAILKQIRKAINENALDFAAQLLAPLPDELVGKVIKSTSVKKAAGIIDALLDGGWSDNDKRLAWEILIYVPDKRLAKILEELKPSQCWDILSYDSGIGYRPPVYYLLSEGKRKAIECIAPL